ncbi:GntR family transcriptional regulator [Enterococcus termitis]|jgi:DNA-binding GntR family transcriptional regulator|uniref:HTH gntR-type domain-containing protein n=1 Tax=Enterococcus termitis TaxID=332950 RepID=A0A1E5GAT0_9ENTE|nr:GntR family transcriptional regulator [Enterococcus termitis]OEG09777.1 hypothetical protein BCR25_09720 [Enterococcus termitis]OJG96906.1 hypothetical protein RV18_GL001744 [Enterococcus termitis]
MITLNNKDEAYTQIKEKIITLEILPGQKVSKKDFVSMLNIGDTPVREAILQLTREGLLIVKPQSGTFVSKIDMQKVREAKFVRTNLESAVFLEAAEIITAEQIQEIENLLAIQEILLSSKTPDSFFESDEEFHKFFYTITSKMNVYNWLLTLNIHLNRYRHLTLEVKELNWQEIVTQHKEIVAALKEKDKTKLQNLITSHLKLVDDNYTFVKKEFPDYFVDSNIND